MMNNLETSICKRCGYEHFTPYAELGIEEKIIADSRNDDPTTDVETENLLVCARCFSTVQKREIRA